MQIYKYAVAYSEAEIILRELTDCEEYQRRRKELFASGKDFDPVFWDRYFLHSPTTADVRKAMEETMESLRVDRPMPADANADLWQRFQSAHKKEAERLAKALAALEAEQIQPHITTLEVIEN